MPLITITNKIKIEAMRDLILRMNKYENVPRLQKCLSLNEKMQRRQPTKLKK